MTDQRRKQTRMHRQHSTPRNYLLILLSLSLLLVGCAGTTFDMKTAEVPKGARVGVLIVDGDGFPAGLTFQRTHVYEAIAEADLVPVALADASLKVFFPEGAAPVAAPGAQSEVRPDYLFASLQPFLQSKEVDYVMLIDMWTSALDEDLKVVIVRTSDLQVVASRAHSRRVMAKLWATTTPVLGLGLLICPWFYLASAEQPNGRALKSDLVSYLRSVVGGESEPKRRTPPVDGHDAEPSRKGEPAAKADPIRPEPPSKPEPTTPKSPKPASCTSDKDCEGQDLCEKGVCVPSKQP